MDNKNQERKFWNRLENARLQEELKDIPQPELEELTKKPPTLEEKKARFHQLVANAIYDQVTDTRKLDKRRTGEMQAQGLQPAHGEMNSKDSAAVGSLASQALEFLSKDTPARRDFLKGFTSSFYAQFYARLEGLESEMIQRDLSVPEVQKKIHEILFADSAA